MLPAIELNHYSFLKADEINDVVSDALLPPEFEATYPFRPEMSP
jgi:hypothetical protein